MRVLITGASGLLGLNLALELATEHTVYGVVHNNRIVTEDFEVIQADLLSPEEPARVFERARPDWVIHCAALADLEACEANPQLAQRLNADLPARIAAEAQRRGARLVHISTDAVFDGLRGGYTEEEEPNPPNAYARSKLAGERAVAQANPKTVVARVNIFGWSLSGSRSLAEFFFNNLSAGKSVPGFTDVFFCPLLVNHLAAILVSIFRAELSGLYHLVASGCLSKYEFGVAIARRFGLDGELINPVSVEEVGLTAPRSPNMTLRIEKLSAALGESLPDVASGLDRFHQLYQQGYPQQLQEMKVN